MKKSTDETIVYYFKLLPFITFFTCLYGFVFSKDPIPIIIPVKFIVWSTFCSFIAIGIYRRLANLGSAIFFLFLSLLLLGSFSGILQILVTSIATYWLFRVSKGLRTNLDPQPSGHLCTIGYAAVLGLLPLTVLPEGWANFNIQKSIMSGIVHGDSLFFMSLATMFQKYGIFSTGLHGIPPLDYHLLVHLFYVAISNLIHTPIYVTYGWATLTFLAPLLIVTLLAYSSELSHELNSQSKFRPVSILILVACFIGFLGRSHFDKAGAFNSYLLSESYLFGLILLLASFSIYLNGNIRKPFILVILTLATVFSKISIGAVTLVTLLFFEMKDLKTWNRTKILTLLSLGLTGTVAYWFVRGYGGSNKVVELQFDFLYFPRTYGAELREPFYLPFLFTHYFYPIVASTLYGAMLLWDRKLASLCKKQHQALWISVLVGLPSMHFSIVGGTGYYFTNISMFLAIPILLVTASYWATRVKQKGKETRVIAYALAGFAMISIIHYGFYEIKCAIRSFKNRNTNGVPICASCNEGRGTVSELTPYLNQLIKISKEVPKDILVYIPRKETAFWGYETNGGSTGTHRPSLLIPTLSGHPGIFALRDHSPMYNYYGYRNPESLERSEVDEISNEVLMIEAKRLGFAGYVRVRNDGFDIFR